MIAASTPLHDVLINLRKHIHALLEMMSLCMISNDLLMNTNVMKLWDDKDEKIFDFFTVAGQTIAILFTFEINAWFNTVKLFPK